MKNLIHSQQQKQYLTMKLSWLFLCQKISICRERNLVSYLLLSPFYIIDANAEYLFKMWLIEADRISNPDNARDTDRLVQGIEKNAAGEAIAVHICNQHPSSWKKGVKKQWQRVEIFGRESGRRNFVLKMEMLRPDQDRGIPILAPVIEPLKQLARYTEAELQAAVVSGAFAVFLKMDPSLATTASGSPKPCAMATTCCSASGVIAQSSDCIAAKIR